MRMSQMPMNVTRVPSSTSLHYSVASTAPLRRNSFAAFTPSNDFPHRSSSDFIQAQQTQPQPPPLYDYRGRF